MLGVATESGKAQSGRTVSVEQRHPKGLSETSELQSYLEQLARTWTPTLRRVVPPVAGVGGRDGLASGSPR